MILPIRGAVQGYSWGQIGPKSEVAQIALSSGAIPSIEPDKPYAEIWFGTHPNGPAYALREPGEALPLSDAIGHQMSFLLKCLSVRQSLSIQAHPDDGLAKVLHSRHPDHYPDDQAKPEMAIAVNGDFEALVGFRPLGDLRSFLRTIPPLRELVFGKNLSEEIEDQSADGEEQAKGLYKRIVRKIMSLPEDELSNALALIMKHLAARRDLSPPKKVFFKLYGEYPGDVGCLYAFLLNHVVLKEGECMFLGANEPHAYLSGDCVELMNCSDNVVRAGLTSKYKDVDTLLSMLTYESSDEGRFIIQGKRAQCGNVGFVKYDPPGREFSLEKVLFNEGVAQVDVNEESIFLCMGGRGKIVLDGGQPYGVSRGASFYAMPSTLLCVDVFEGLVLFRSFKATL